MTEGEQNRVRLRQLTEKLLLEWAKDTPNIEDLEWLERLGSDLLCEARFQRTVRFLR